MYDESLRKAMLSAKWSFSAVQIKSLGALLAEHRRNDFLAVQADVVAPIPSVWQQRLIRYFNPAGIVATEIARALQIPCENHLLHRTRQTRPQKRVSVSQRFENQSGSIGVSRRQNMVGQRILVVDDVMTTGATLSEAARALKSAGASSVHAAIVARVLDHSA